MDPRRISLDDVLVRVRATPSRAPARVVGVDGPSGSGKSTLARRLRAHLGDAALIKCDDFVSWTDLTTWWPRFAADVLDPLRAGRDIRYQVRDWVGDEFGSTLKGWKTARATPLVIVEGVGATRREADVDYAIWVEAPLPTRLRRGLARDGEDHLGLWKNWQVMEQDFFAADDTRARADLRVDSDDGHPGDDLRVLP